MRCSLSSPPSARTSESHSAGVWGEVTRSHFARAPACVCMAWRVGRPCMAYGWAVERGGDVAAMVRDARPLFCDDCLRPPFFFSCGRAGRQRCGALLQHRDCVGRVGALRAMAP